MQATELAVSPSARAVKPSALAVRNLSKVYRGGNGIRGLDFTIDEGEIFGFLGPNGAGKTTTIRVILGLLRPTGGSAEVKGFDCWAAGSSARSLIGFVPGDPHLYDRMTGAAFVDYLAGFRARGAAERGRRLADQLDLDLHRRIRQLSRGNRQKLLLVQALMHDPPVLVLDEPTGGLDPLGQAAFLDLLIGERSRGKTVFLSSHDLHEVERVADRIAVIRDGRLVAVEDVDRLKALRERKMEITLARAAEGRPFDGLDGVRVIAEHDQGRRVELAVRGRTQALLARLAQLPVLDFEYPPADLESVFLHYYRDADGASPQAGRRSGSAALK